MRREATGKRKPWQTKACATFLLSLALLPAQQPEPPVTFRSSSNLVIVNVFVRDKKGNPIRGLKKEDFTITENGKPQSISVFEFQELTLDPAPAVPAAAAAPPEEAPARLRFRDKRLLVLFFDFGGMQPVDQIRTIDAAKKFVNEKLTASDMVQVMSNSSELRVDQEFTNDREKLLKAIGAFQPGEGIDLAEGAAAEETEDPEAALAADDSEFNVFNTDRKLAALESAARMLAVLPEKKALVYFSGSSGKTGVENHSQLRAAVNASVKANVSLYTIDVRGLQAEPPGGDASQSGKGGTGLFSGGTQTKQRNKFHDQQETLANLASDTGGKALLDSNDLTLGITRAQTDLQSYYILGYYGGDETKDGKFRRLSVKLAPQLDAKLDYRTGFYASKEWKAFNSSDRERQLEEALMLGEPLTQLALAVEVDYFRLNPTKYFIPVAIKIPGSAITLEEKGKSRTTEFEVIGQVRDLATGRTAASLRDGIPIKITAEGAAELARRSVLYDTGFTLPAGKYSLKVLVRENYSGKMGTFETHFTAPSSTVSGSQLALSSAVWSSQRAPLKEAIGSAQKPKKQSANHPLIQDGMKLAPSVTRVFRTGQKLFVYLEAYDAKPRDDGKSVSVAAKLGLYRGRHRVLETEAVRVEQPLANRVSAAPLQFQVPLDGLKPGRYMGQITVVDELGRKFGFERAPIVVMP